MANDANNSSNNNNNNNNSLTTSAGTADLQPLAISTSAMLFVTIFLCILLHGGMSSIGVVSNAVSTLVFTRQGLSDSMTIGLFSLSLCDFFVCFLQLAISFCYIVSLVVPDYAEDPNVVRIVILAYPRYVVYLISVCITALISTERCLCVTFPFHVRRAFRRSRYITAVVVICAVNIGFHIPLQKNQQIGWQIICVPDEQGNVTKLATTMKTIFLDDMAIIELVTDIWDLALSTLCQLIIIVCSFWMITVLKLSSSVRAKQTFVPGDTTHSGQLARKGGSVAGSYNRSLNLSDRERRLVRVVAALAIYLTLCNIPHFVAVSVYHAWFKHIRNPETANFERFMWRISDLSHILSASLNFLVHLRLNVGYRQTLKKMVLNCPHQCKTLFCMGRQ